jgi:serine acetyltransferase
MQDHSIHYGKVKIGQDSMIDGGVTLGHTSKTHW